MATKIPKQGSRLEAKFARFWKLLGGAELTPEVRFHPVRKWRFDFVVGGALSPTIESVKVAFEIEGGVFSRGKSGHTSGLAISQDCEKYNTAAMMGWIVFRLTEKQITTANLEPLIAFVKTRKAQLG